MEEIKDLIAKNLILFRKNAKLTQLELAEKLKYSDKNISKWERGESVPDVVVLKQLADLYGIKIDDFFAKEIKVQNNDSIKNEPKTKTKIFNKKQLLISLLSISLVWLTAIILFSVFINANLFLEKAWLCFIYAIMVSFIVALVFTSLWCTNLMNAIMVSFLIWSSALSFYLTTNFPDKWAIFIVCIPIQILDILWFILRKVNKNLKNQDFFEQQKIRKEEKLKKKQEKKEQKRNKLLLKTNNKDVEKINVKDDNKTSVEKDLNLNKDIKTQ